MKGSETNLKKLCYVQTLAKTTLYHLEFNCDKIEAQENYSNKDCDDFLLGNKELFFVAISGDTKTIIRMVVENEIIMVYDTKNTLEYDGEDYRKVAEDILLSIFQSLSEIADEDVIEAKYDLITGDVSYENQIIGNFGKFTVSGKTIAEICGENNCDVKIDEQHYTFIFG